MGLFDNIGTKGIFDSIGVKSPAVGAFPSISPTMQMGGESTPAFSNVSTANYVKDIFSGGAETAGGTTRNTIVGLPQAAVSTVASVGKGLFDSIAHPDAEQQAYESQMLPDASNPILRTLTAPGVAAARIITRLINPGLRPVANDLAEIRAVNEKGGLADQIAAGTIPSSTLDELAVLHKTAPQVVGDVAQAVLTAYAGGEGTAALEKSTAQGFKAAVKTGFTSGLQTGELFGTAQAASSGSKNPLEIAGTIGTSGLAGGVLGAIISGAIPASKEVFNKAVEAKAYMDAHPELQRGFIKNPLGEEVPKGNPLVPKNKTLEEINQEIAKEEKEGKGFASDRKLAELDRQKKIIESSPDSYEGVTASRPSEGIPVESPRVPQTKETLSTVPSTLESPRQTVPSAQPQLLNPLHNSYSDTLPQDFNPDKYVKDQVKLAEAARTGEKPSIFGKTKTFLADVKRKLVDFTSPIEDILSKTVKENRLKLKPEDDIHNQIDRVLRSPTLAGRFAEDNGIAEVIRKVDNPDALDQYLIAKHAVELENRGVETGRDSAKDSALISALADKYEPYAKVVSDYSKKLLDYSVQSGLISAQLADTLRRRYPDYVPFQRIFNEVEKTQGHGSKAVASLSKQSIVQKIEGSKRQIESPIESLLVKTNDAFKQGEKNIAGRILASYKDLPGNPFKLRELKPGEHADHTISFMDNGEKKTFETTAEIEQAAKSLNLQQLNILGRMLAFPVRIAKLGITGINLPFIASNIAKDAVTAFINSDHGLRTSIANPVNFVRSLASAVGHDALYDEMVRAGGAGTSFDISRNQVENSVARIRSGRNAASKIKYTVTHPGELLRAVEDIIGRGEEFTRIQQYRGTKQAELAKGASELSAQTAGARQARDATVNFARRGEWGTVLNSAFLYINAGIQGTRSLLRNFKDKPIQTATKVAVSALFPMAVATSWNLSDKNRKKAYDDIDEYEKENNIIIVPNNPTQDAQGRWNVIKIPLSQEVNNLVALSRRTIEAMHGLDPIGFGDFAKAIAGTVSPVNPTKGSVLSTVVPQAIKPTLEAAANTNFFTGIPQVSQGLENLPAAAQVKPYTSGTARQIGQRLNVSPIKVENFIKSTFGGVGSQALNVVDNVLAKVGVIPKDQIGGQAVLDAIGARFNKASGGAVASKFYDAQKIADQVHAAERADFKATIYDKVQGLKDGGDSDGAQAIVDGLSDEDYKTYVNIRTAERSKHTSKLRDLLKQDPEQAVAYVRSQRPDEAERLVNLLDDVEYKLYEKGKQQ